MKAFITGIGWVTAENMGCGGDHDSFDMKAGELPEITRKAVFEKPYPHFGRLDIYSRLGLAAISFALKDAGLAKFNEKRPIGIIASTVHGCLDTDIDYFDTVIPENGRLASPNLFAYTLPNSYLGEAAIHFGLTGATFAICELSISGLLCIRMALLGINGEGFEVVLAGVCDVGNRPPFTVANEALCGAVFFVIEKTSGRDCFEYGKLSLDQKGNLEFNGAEVRDLVGLAQDCMAVSTGSVNKQRIDQ